MNIFSKVICELLRFSKNRELIKLSTKTDIPDLSRANGKLQTRKPAHTSTPANKPKGLSEKSFKGRRLCINDPAVLYPASAECLIRNCLGPMTVILSEQDGLRTAELPYMSGPFGGKGPDPALLCRCSIV